MENSRAGARQSDRPFNVTQKAAAILRQRRADRESVVGQWQMVYSARQLLLEPRPHHCSNESSAAEFAPAKHHRERNRTRLH